MIIHPKDFDTINNNTKKADKLVGRLSFRPKTDDEFETITLNSKE
jgi:hypothetical protein